MKKQVIAVMVLLFSVTVFAQKREVRKAENAVEDKEFNEAMAYLKEAEASISTADKELQAQFYLVKAEANQGSAGNDAAKMKAAVDAYLKAKEHGALEEFDERMANLQNNLRVMLVNSAIEDQNAKRYKTATEKLYQSYTVSPKDTSDLYFAAGNAVNGTEYDSALEYYNKLMELGYTGKSVEYVAIEKDTGEERLFESKQERDLMLKAGEVIKPTERMSTSRVGDILRNMTLIYIQKGEEDKAKELMAKARAENPDDISLIQAEANMAYKMGDKEKYRSLMEKVATAQSDNPNVLYNLAVSTADLGDTNKAIELYKKALEINPEYTDALLNIAVLKLSKEKEIVEKMNSLGNSTADNKRYDELKEERKELYREALPYLEKVNTLKEDLEIKRTLMNIYSQLGMDDKFKAMKAEVDAMDK